MGAEGWCVWCWLRGNKDASPSLWGSAETVSRERGLEPVAIADGTLQLPGADVLDEEVASALELWADIGEKAMARLGGLGSVSCPVAPRLRTP